MKQTTGALIPGIYYHIYNRGNNRENLFFEERNYGYFLSLYAKHIVPVADTFAYCLMKNHFHLCVRIKNEEEFVEQTSQVSKTCEVSSIGFNPSKCFSNFFNAYAKAINEIYGRTGGLYEGRFGRIAINSSPYILTLIYYIHLNPEKHGFVDDFRNWKWSSYNSLISDGTTRLNRDDCLNIFGGVNGFVEFHRSTPDDRIIKSFVDEKFEQYPA